VAELADAHDSKSEVVHGITPMTINVDMTSDSRYVGRSFRVYRVRPFHMSEIIFGGGALWLAVVIKS